MVILNLNQAGQVLDHVVVCSTDTSMSAQQLEFVFRDAKHYTNLTSCPLRSKKGLENHWNAALLTVSLARAEQLLSMAARTGSSAEQLVFLVEDAKRRAFNILFAKRILTNLGLSQRFDELQNHPSRPLDLGVKAA